MPDNLPLSDEPGLLFYASLGLIGLAAFLMANTFFSSEEKFKAGEKLDDVDAKNDKGKNNGVILTYSRPFFKRYFSPMVANLKNKKKIREMYRRPLANAGLSYELTPDDFFAFKLFLIIGFPILFMVIKEFGEFYDWPMIASPMSGIVGFFYPNIWINGMIQKRQREILHGLPFVVDMLALSVEAGLDFMAAITKVVDKAKKSALTDELETILKEIKIGSSRAEALRAFAWRVNVLEVSSFSATLIAADSVGASIGPILKVLSADIRQKKSAAVEKEGATAATKILIPMIFLIVPAVGIIIAAPLIIEFIPK